MLRYCRVTRPQYAPVLAARFKARAASPTADHWGRTELKYPLRKLAPAENGSGFRPPLGPSPDLPFLVHRTASQQLPVYSDVRKGGSLMTTIVRKFDGDWKELSNEISALLGGVEVMHHPGRLEVKGRYVGTIKNWLLQLGF